MQFERAETRKQIYYITERGKIQRGKYNVAIWYGKEKGNKLVATLKVET